MAKKRERLEIIRDILNTANKIKNIGPTKLLHSSNLSPQMFNEYLSELLEKNFIIESKEKKKRIYFLSKKGKEFLNEYFTIEKVIKNFGL